MSSNPMVSLMSVPEAKQHLCRQMKDLRLGEGLTQEGLANRSGVPLPTLRKFEQRGTISHESFLKLLVVLGKLEAVIDALKQEEESFNSIDDMLADRPAKPRKRGWRT